MATRILPEASGASVDDRVRAVVRTLLGAADMKAGDLARGIGMTKAQVWDRQRGDKAPTPGWSWAVTPAHTRYVHTGRRLADDDPRWRVWGRLYMTCVTH
jgi:hypothetical protein